jgi:hypothetical protein
VVQPKPCDVVIQKTSGHPSVFYVLGTLASPGQFSFHDRDEAIRHAVGYARYAHVGAWMLNGDEHVVVGPLRQDRELELRE